MILSLSEIREADTPEVGQKAATLARLLQAGFAVPPGFCVSAAVYRTYISTPLREGGRTESIREISVRERERERGRLRQQLLDAPLSRELRDEIRSHYAALSETPVAVRSSATTEDLAAHSSAGIYESWLGISSFEDCLDAIKKCWASVWTEHAYLYRETRGIDHFGSNMCVLVQQLISARAAGVVFTENPSGQSSSIVVEGSFGLATQMASHGATMDRFLIDRRDLRIANRTITPKSVAVVPGAQGGLVERAIPEAEARSPCLDEPLLRRLAALALQVEERLDAAQDLEWAMNENQLYVIQSRPLIGAMQPRRRGDLQVWSNFNVSEVLPGPVSPMSHSLLDPGARRALDLVLKRLGMDLGDSELTTQIAGRPYFNVNLLIGIQERLPAAFRIDLAELLGSEQESMPELDSAGQAARDLPQLKFSRLKLCIGFPGLVWWFLFGALAEGARVARATNQRAARIRRLDLAALTDEELANCLQDAVMEVSNCAPGLAANLVAMRYFDALAAVCRRFFPTENGLASRLLASGDTVDSAEAALALWRLAVTAQKHPQIGAVILQEHSPTGLRARLKRVVGGDAFLQQWDDYLAEHGHHAVGELELLTPRWSDDPTTLLDHLRSYLLGMDQLDPPRKRAEGIRISRETADRCRRRLGWNLYRRFVFAYLVRRAGLGSAVRENMKSALIRLLAAVRFLLIETGRRAVERSVLEHVEDVFFLRRDELGCLEAHPEGRGLAEVAKRRRAEHEENKLVTPPAVIVGTWGWYKSCQGADAGGEQVPQSADNTYEGLAVSSGVAIGPARVISGRDSREQLLPGEVLVAPYTDPGWVPHFLRAAAIVVDVGGLLSHGSILARELGIPAVVNVRSASQTIKTGQLVEVDGDRGLVRIVH